MKRVIIDENLCQGAKECAAIAPEAIDISDDGIASATGAVLSNDTAAFMESACPSMAITAVDVESD
jgi:ferredoxin